MPSGTIVLAEDSRSDGALTTRPRDKGRIANELIIAENGQEALDDPLATSTHARRDPSDVPSLTLLDPKLPKVPGLEVLRRIRVHTALRRMPVVLVTSSKDEQDLATGYDLGVNSYIPKAVDFKQF